MTWTANTGEDAFPDGRGTDGGIVVADDEHDLWGARITLERDTMVGPASVTCGLYGWMVHTRHFPDLETARAAFEAMKPELSQLVVMVPMSADPDCEPKKEALIRAITAFVDKYP